MKMGGPTLRDTASPGRDGADASPWLVLLPAVGGGLAASMILMVVTLGVRPDLRRALAGLESVKLTACAILAVCAVALCRAAMRRAPDGLPILLALPAMTVFTAPAWLEFSIPSGDRATVPLVIGLQSFGAIVALSLPALAIVVMAMRLIRPPSPVLAGLGAGLLAGGLGSLAYAFHCTGDNAMMISFWYPAAIACVSFAGVTAGRRWLGRRA